MPRLVSLIGRAAAIGAVIGLTCAAPGPTFAQSTPGNWSLKAPLPSARSEVAAVALGGELHAIGGSVDGVARPFHDMFDPATNRWQQRAALPEGRDHVALAVSGDRIYAFGGFTSSVHKGAGTDAFAYDPKTDSWSTLPPMKFARGAAGAAAIDGKIHVIGGRGLDGVTIGSHEVFDPKAGTWSEAAPLPTARDHMVVIAVGGKIHVIGGRFKGPVDRTGLHDVYDPATDRWTSAAPLPTPRSGLAGAFYRGLILVLGGELPPDTTFAENEGYDPNTGRWTSLAPMPHGRHGFGGAVIGDAAYFAGGSLRPGGGGASDEVIRFQMP